VKRIESREEVLTTTCPRDCYDTCGITVIRRDGLVDEDFIAAHVLGWEEIEPTIAACDLAKLSALTGVPAALIEQAAHLYGAGPSLLWLGQGLPRQATGGNVMRACAHRARNSWGNRRSSP